MARGKNRGLRPPTEDGGGASTDRSIAREAIRQRGRAPVTVQYFKHTHPGSVLRQRLDTTMPMHRESRVDCIARFRVAVDWLNAHRSELLMKDCTNQTARSDTVMLSESGCARD